MSKLGPGAVVLLWGCLLRGPGSKTQGGGLARLTSAGFPSRLGAALGGRPLGQWGTGQPHARGAGGEGAASRQGEHLHCLQVPKGQGSGGAKELL